MDRIEGLSTVDLGHEGKLGLVRVDSGPRIIVLGFPASRLAHEVDRQVGDDSIKPGEKARPPLEAVEASVNPQESFLDQVASVVLVADHPQGNGERASLVALDEPAEGGCVSSLGSLNENTVFLGFGTSGF